MSVALILLFIAAGVIVVGIVITLVGLILDPGPGNQGVVAVAQPSLLSRLLSMITKCFAKIMDPKTRKWEKVSAFGMLLVFVGFAFLLSSAITAILTPSGGDPMPTPTPTST